MNATTIAPLHTWPEDERPEERTERLIPRDSVPATLAETQRPCSGCGHIVGQHETLGCLGGSAYFGPCSCPRDRRSLVAQQRRERAA